jgi:hypothetical protein
MRLRTRLAVAGVAAIAFSACSESDSPFSPGNNTRVEVSSDPEGAAIFLNGTNTGKVTTDLLRDLAINRVHEILVRLDRDNVAYGYRAQVEVANDSLHRVLGPLLMRCTSEVCSIQNHRYHTLGNMRVATNPNGALFYYDGNGSGLLYPTGSSNAYAAMGMPLVSMVAGGSDTLALGIYDRDYLAGRPAPQVTQAPDRYTMQQSFWIVPPTGVIVGLGPTVRGIEVEEQLIATTATNDVAFVKLTFRNITNRPSYKAADPIVPSGGLTFTSVYVGFGLDADIGVATDDAIPYDPALDMVYSYDMNLEDGAFGTGFTDRPALVGLRLLAAPAGAPVKVLNAWPAGVDWSGGDPSERIGWGVMSGTRSVMPDLPGQQLGHAPTTPGDYRMSVSAGPLTLNPGAEASIVVAIVVALPVQGTYMSGQLISPGDPTVADRQIARVAADLLAKAGALTVPQ